MSEFESFVFCKADDPDLDFTWLMIKTWILKIGNFVN